jgi:hypothetical protein
MFNIDTAILAWRKGMVAAGLKQSASLDELEEHLRADVERQTRSGVNVELAFSNAVAQIGAAPRVRDEVKKVRLRGGASIETWISACIPFLITFVFGSLALAFWHLHMQVMQQILGFIGVSVILGVSCGWRWYISRVPVIQNPAMRFFLCVLCFALAFACPAGLAWLAERRLDPSSNDYVIALIWVCLPMPLLTCLAQSFVMDRKAREHWGMTSHK